MAEETAEILRDSLKRILEEYPTPMDIGPGTEFETAHSDHPMYQLVVNQAGAALEDLVDTGKYTTKASVGRGSPTFIPYLAIMHTDETKSPQKGRYVVYLFDPIERTLYLTLNQGATEAKEIASNTDSTAEEILRSRAQAMAEDVDLPGFTNERTEFTPSGEKSRLYGAGTVCYKAYRPESFPDANTIYEDLERLLRVYDDLISEPLPQIQQRNPTVWIEKTGQEGREYKQEGDLALGKALISPSRDEAGRKRYETMREANVGDIVLHLLQEDDEIVGVSRIASELRDDFEGPPDDRWTEKQREQGGYLRELEDYTELDDPIDIYDDVLNNEQYGSQLTRIREETDAKIIYSKRLTLNQGHYFTRVPSDFLAILTAESDDLPDKLRNFGVEIPDSPTDLPNPVESYGSITDAMDDIQNRLDRSAISNWLGTELTTTVIEDWSEVLTNFGPDSTVSPKEEVRLRQIQKLFENNESRLEKDADTLGSGALNNLTEAQTLFVAFLRDLQNQAGVNTNINQVKIKIVLNDEYDVNQTSLEEPPERESEEEKEEKENKPKPSHPLLTHLDSLSASSPVRKFTAPPDYWFTVLQYGTVSFEEQHYNIWESIEEGELVFLHSGAEPGREEIPNQPNGIFGVGILGSKSTKEELWWADETEDEPFPYLITFDRLYVTSNISELDVGTPVSELSSEDLETQLQTLTADLLEFEEVQSICQETNGISFPAQGAHKTFRNENNDPDHARPRALLEALASRLQETTTVNTHSTFNGTLSTDPFDGLYFPGTQKADLVEQIESALRSGKHIILTGPPGTGKTEIARLVLKYLVAEYPYFYSDFQLTTATADWSTFDTVGGYMPEESSEDGDELSFTPGVILNRLKTRRTGVQVNEPVLIDELNRADIDKAFGQLFTLLSGQSVQLPYTRGGEEIELLSAGQTDQGPASHQYVVPESWRIFATMNTYDKTSLYEMSYAFMRRFAFIRVGAPDLPDDIDELDKLMRRYADVWGIRIGRRERRDVGRVWRQMNTAVEERAIGPAIVKDILAYVSHASENQFNDALTRAIISFIFPQL